MSRFDVLVVHDDGSTLSQTLGEIAAVVNEQSRRIEALEARVNQLGNPPDVTASLADLHAVAILKDAGVFPERA